MHYPQHPTINAEGTHPPYLSAATGQQDRPCVNQLRPLNSFILTSVGSIVAKMRYLERKMHLRGVVGQAGMGRQGWQTGMGDGRVWAMGR